MFSFEKSEKMLTDSIQTVTLNLTDIRRIEMEKLKLCPFCRGKAEMLISEYEDSRKEYLATCTECDGMVERWRETEKEAAEQWNRRVNNE